MLFWRSRRRAGITKQQMTAAVPVRNAALEFQTEAGRVRVVYPPLSGWRRRWLTLVQQEPQRKVLELDELGAEFLAWCDGRREVREIIGLLRRSHHLSWKEAEVTTLSFLRELGRRGVVGMVVPAAGERQGEV